MNPSFRNPAPIDLVDDDPRSVDLEAFPTFDDVSIELLEGVDGRELSFVSTAHGRLAGFPYWEHPERDLRHLVAVDVPVGPIDDPFDERDEAWRILIFAHGGFVYLLEGDAPNATRFPTWFRIPVDRYVEAWRLVIEAFNPAPVLDDIFPEPDVSEPN